MWEQSCPALLEVIEELSPDVILVLGKELAKKLPKISEKYKLCKIQHPSSGFSAEKWVPIFKESLV